MAIGLATAQTFLLLLLRTASLLMVVPFFGELQVPARIRLGLAVVLSACLCHGLPPALAEVPSISGLLGSAARETLLGLVGGLGARLVFEASSAAGFLAGTSMGLGFGASAGMGSDGPVVSQLVRALALTALVAMGVHRQVIVWLYESVRAYPPGQSTDLVKLLSSCVGYGLFSMALTVRIAFPLLAASLLGHAALGIAGKAAPQINLASVGFSVTILTGGTAIYFAAPLIASGVAQATIASVTP